MFPDKLECLTSPLVANHFTRFSYTRGHVLFSLTAREHSRRNSHTCSEWSIAFSINEDWRWRGASFVKVMAAPLLALYLLLSLLIP